MNLRIISAGAGSGKTYRLTSEMVALLKRGIRPTGIVATTFTNKAAAELQERVRVRLLEEGLTEAADAIANALIGTVHSLGVRLLRRFAFEAGVSPQVDIIADEDQQVLFNRALSMVLTEDRAEQMDALVDRFNLEEGYFDWRRDLRQLIEVARSNAFSRETLEISRRRSFEQLRAFLNDPSGTPEAWDRELREQLQATASCLQSNGDTTKTTADAVRNIRRILRDRELKGRFDWAHWARIGKLKVGAKSREDAKPLLEFARTHEQHPGFHRQLQAFIDHLFELAMLAMEEYQRYKKERGLIDYTDMEVLIVHLLDQPRVRNVLAGELDLLMVDEFQDTNPMQLEIFLKLSAMVDQAVWVGDPKQSIYGFRGAEPSLMKAVIEAVGGVKPEDIQGHSWRSREELVYLSNALFTEAFSELPPEQVALQPMRRVKAGEHTANNTDEPPGTGTALVHWHIDHEGNGRPPAAPWQERALAELLAEWLEEGVYVLPKGESHWRAARPGDVAVLCKKNKRCAQVAEALHRAGLRASIARNGLFQTAEAKLVLACLRYLLNREDSLSVAELMLLASQTPLEDIIEQRFDHLEAGATESEWGAKDPFLQDLSALRQRTAEHSATELLNMLLEEMDLRRKVLRLGNGRQRLANIEALRKLAVDYEDRCNRLHAAASLGGFLLWLEDLERQGLDMQGASEGPDAVQVLTYHKSKGLEWPIVIAYDLGAPLRANPWGMAIVPERETVDLDHVLAHRWLRYWVNPYGRQVANTPLDQRLKESDLYAGRVSEARDEEARLLYVGFTRARDYLVLPSSSKEPTRWLNRVWQHGQENAPTLDHRSGDSPWIWEGKALPKKNVWRQLPADIPARQQADLPVPYLKAGSGPKTYPPEAIQPEELISGKDFSARVDQVLQYGEGLALPVGQPTYTAGKVVKAFLHAFRTDYPPAEQLAIASGLIRDFGLAEELDAQDLLDLARQWAREQTQRFRPEWVRHKDLVRWVNGDRLFERVADVLLETSEGEIALIQRSTFRGKRKLWRNKALELAGLFWLFRQGLRADYPDRTIRTFLHLPLEAALLEVVATTPSEAPVQGELF